jgi:hypothetical protein
MGVLGFTARTSSRVRSARPAYKYPARAAMDGWRRGGVKCEREVLVAYLLLEHQPVVWAR